MNLWLLAFAPLSLGTKQNLLTSASMTTVYKDVKISLGITRREPRLIWYCTHGLLVRPIAHCALRPIARWSATHAFRKKSLYRENIFCDECNCYICNDYIISISTISYSLTSKIHQFCAVKRWGISQTKEIRVLGRLAKSWVPLALEGGGGDEANKQDFFGAGKKNNLEKQILLSKWSSHRDGKGSFFWIDRMLNNLVRSSAGLRECNPATNLEGWSIGLGSW